MRNIFQKSEEPKQNVSLDANFVNKGAKYKGSVKTVFF